MLDDSFILVGDLLTLKGGKTSQLQVKDRLSLDLGKGETLHRLLQFGYVRLECSV